MALVLVLCRHYPWNPSEFPWLQLSRFGWIGVPLFFVLSGYLITKQLLVSARNTESTSTQYFTRFYIRRSLRIFPAYWATLLLYFCVPVLAENYPPAPLWKFLTFTQNFGLNVMLEPAFSHAWSLCVEEQFYLILPWLVALCVRAKKDSIFQTSIIVASALIVFVIFIRVGVFVSMRSALFEAGIFQKYLYYPTYSSFDGLILGSLLSVIELESSKTWKWFKENRLFIVVIIPVMFAGVIYLMDHRYSIRSVSLLPFLLGLFFSTLLISTLTYSSFFVFSFRIQNVLAWFADLVFCAYLTHKMAMSSGIKIAERVGYDSNSWATHALIWFFIFGFAWVLRFLIEKPFLKLRDRYIKRDYMIARL